MQQQTVKYHLIALTQNFMVSLKTHLLWTPKSVEAVVYCIWNFYMFYSEFLVNLTTQSMKSSALQNVLISQYLISYL